MQIVSTQRDPLYFLEKLRPREGGHAHGEACACDTRGSAAKRLSFSSLYIVLLRAFRCLLLV